MPPALANRVGLIPLALFLALGVAPKTGEQGFWENFVPIVFNYRIGHRREEPKNYIK